MIRAAIGDALNDGQEVRGSERHIVAVKVVGHYGRIRKMAAKWREIREQLQNFQRMNQESSGAINAEEAVEA
jgi:flagellar biosynthesis/type III secretory pathway chaperone